jgi:hypothetical protein
MAHLWAVPLFFKMKKLAGAIIFAGAILKIADHQYGQLIFITGFIFYYLLKLFTLPYWKRNFLFSGYHKFHVAILIAGIFTALLYYLEYPYAKLFFYIFLFLEPLISLKIWINAFVGADNAKAISRFIKSLF